MIKRVLHWVYVMSFIIRQILDLKNNILRREVGVARRYNCKRFWLWDVNMPRITHTLHIDFNCSVPTAALIW